MRLANGFFCYIPSKEIPVLVTDNHSKENNYLQNQKKTKIEINKDKNNKFTI